MVSWIGKIFFRIRIQKFVPDSDSKSNILLLQFIKSFSDDFHMYSRTCKTEKKFCYRKNMHYALFQLFNIWFFFYLFADSIWICIRIRTTLFGFGLNLRILNFAPNKLWRLKMRVLIRMTFNMSVYGSVVIFYVNIYKFVWKWLRSYGLASFYGTWYSCTSTTNLQKTKKMFFEGFHGCAYQRPQSGTDIKTN
jgi:hypothetical protein